ncbi:winged helix-turn-helix transcriptional regulator [Secundilactobacillus folii]|uniref:HxlR family transcriptional regulator n=1 Tax=Secundilactobacillus folii TaxID=2678357 RepID=A0A7X2XTV3_9LACO|nr:winged helix-turn-helix transcriptional regulator [Secundilactobacillus folii]MTV81544.1 HxlR family transcriptional regulator [Secundilactobacillus folii]
MVMRDLNIGTKAGLAVISDKWYALILLNLSDQLEEFMTLRTDLRGISTFNLLLKLQELGELGLVYTKDYHYRLTLDGQYLQQMLTNLSAWGDRQLTRSVALHQEHHQ